MVVFFGLVWFVFADLFVCCLFSSSSALLLFSFLFPLFSFPFSSSFFFSTQVLNTLKKQLGDIINESDWLRREIAARSDMLKRIKRDNISVNDEIMIEKKKLLKFRSAREETEGMPQVIDYVNQKRKEYEVETKIKNWERKIEISEMEARRLRKQRQRAGAFVRS